jgi:hypothetical protein
MRVSRLLAIRLEPSDNWIVMSSWVQDRIRAVTRDAEVEQANREWLLHGAKVFRSKAPLLAKELFVSIESMVSEWNKALARNHARRIEFQRVVPDGILARQVYFPTLQLHAWLDIEDESVRFTLARKVDHSTPRIETQGRLRIILVQDGQLHFANGECLLSDCEEAAQLLLDELFS